MENRRKQISKKAFKIKWSVIIGLLLVVVLGVNIVLFAPLQTVLTNFFAAKVERTPAMKQAASALTEEIEGEGLVLLKNQGNALPLAEGDRKVNVFG